MYQDALKSHLSLYFTNILLNTYTGMWQISDYKNLHCLRCVQRRDEIGPIFLEKSE